MGYSTLFVPDHFDRQWGPLVALSVAAEATTTLKVGSLVLANDYRHPLILAKELATLAMCAPGRLEVGLGAGWLTADYDMAGIELDRPGLRIGRLGESVEIMRRLWSGERFSFDGSHYHIKDAVGAPVPDVPPAVTIGGGGRRILGMAARNADIVGVNASLGAGKVDAQAVASALPERFDERVAWITEAAPDRKGQVELQCLTHIAHVGNNGDDLVASLAPSFGISPDVASQIPLVLVGTVEQVCEAVLARRERWGFNYFVVHDHEAEAFAPVVAKLAGA